jgi:hypothetical protein
MTQPTLTAKQRAAQGTAVDRLNLALAAGTVTVKVGANGAIAFTGWAQDDRAGVSDLCAYRKLAAQNSPQLRRALARAEVIAGRTVDRATVASGTHSHDGGASWHPGH